MKRSSSRSHTPERAPKTHESKSPSKSTTNDKVKICIRIRPSLNEEEWNHNLIITDQDTIKIVKSDLDLTYMKFDKIFTSKLKQDDIFKNLENSIQRFLEGENHSFFAYGQTGAGKTYTMTGDFQETNPLDQPSFLSSEHKGILPRALEKVLEYIRTQEHKCALFGSFFEVYNEKIYDLLNPKSSIKKEGLELRESKDGSNKIPDLMKVEIKNVEDALHCLKVGLKNRIMGCSHANTKSSRSHSIFQLVLVQEDKKNPNNKTTSKLRIVDLAGSEKFKIPKTLDPEERELHILELTSINSSLSALGHCITALAEPNRTHVPFRNSKLTRVLSDSLTGESKITFIVCLSPSMESAQESFSTLQFASRAKKIILDGRHIKKKEEAIKNNTKLLTKSNNVLELFKQLCADKNLVTAMLDPTMVSKINILEKEIKDLKVKNQDLQSQVRELKRSYTPNISPMKQSAESLHSPFRREESKKSISNEPSPSKAGFRRYASQKEMRRPKGVGNSKSVKRVKSMEKKVRFTEDCFTEKVKHEMEYQDNTIFENLSIFKEMEADSKKKSLSIEEIKKIKEQRSNYLKFWSEGEPDVKETAQKVEEKPLLLELISTKGQAKTNLLAQKIKEKEIERKYELFFSLGNKQGQSQLQQQQVSNEDSMHVAAAGNTTYKLLTGPNNSLMSNGMCFGNEQKNMGNDTFNSFDGENERVKQGKKGVEMKPYKELNYIRGSIGNNEVNQSLFSNNNELSMIEPKQNHTIEELTEEAFVSDRKPRGAVVEEREMSQQFYATNPEQREVPLRENQDYNYESCRSIGRSQRDYNSNGMDIIREFDKKLLSVHQLNEQHQELIKNIGLRFGIWQDTSRMLQEYSSAPVKDVEFLAAKLENKGNNGRDVTQVVKNIKQELSDTLSQIQHLKLGEHYNSSSSTLHQQETKSQSQSDQAGDDKSSNRSMNSLERFTWDEAKVKEGSLTAVYSKGNLGKESKYSSNPGSSKSINDIIRKHWSTYKENVK